MTLNYNFFLRLSQALVCALLLGLAANTAVAQGLPPDMDFGSSSSTISYVSAGGALQGTVRGGFFGRIRGGALTQLSFYLDPVNDGGTGRLTEFRLGVDGVSQSSARWYTVTNGKKLVITNLTAFERINGYTPQSHGVATLEITFVNGGAGRVVVTDYRHLYFAGPYTPPRPILGGICDCRPVSPYRVSYTLR
ncbi:MAG: hypothetical protein HYR56_22155 [Acidobacteria bacterium]|nr:hypothetical protein [Acidobacteriota bacterium]MBI3423208.1 hypothetical protein [Acidobacteriota bacterium]